MSEMNEKNVTMNEEMANNEEQNTAGASEQQQDQNEKKDNKVIAFFKKNGKKVCKNGLKTNTAHQKIKNIGGKN